MYDINASASRRGSSSVWASTSSASTSPGAGNADADSTRIRCDCDALTIHCSPRAPASCVLFRFLVCQASPSCHLAKSSSSEKPRYGRPRSNVAGPLLPARRSLRWLVCDSRAGHRPQHACAVKSACEALHDLCVRPSSKPRSAETGREYSKGVLQTHIARQIGHVSATSGAQRGTPSRE